MDEETAGNLLHSLRSALADQGSPYSLPQRDGFPEEGDPDLHSELARIIDEYEALLVDTPEMMKTTMDMLGARTLTFKADPSDLRFEDGRGAASGGGGETV